MFSDRMMGGWLDERIVLFLVEIPYSLWLDEFMKWEMWLRCGD